MLTSALLRVRDQYRAYQKIAFLGVVSAAGEPQGPPRSGFGPEAVGPWGHVPRRSP